MKRLIVYLVLAVMLLSVLASCGARGVILRTDPEVVTTQTKKITLLLENKCGRQIGHGYPRHLQYKVGGEWQYVEFLDPLADSGRPELYIATPNDDISLFAIPIEKWYGSLSVGEYRVEMDYNIGTYPFASKNTHTVAVEFTVTE